MIKKKDLVKQFELLTKQEIKNHNDQILASNIAIKKLNEELISLKMDSSSNWRAIVEMINGEISDQSKIKEDIRKLNSKFSKKEKESAVIVDRNYREMSTLDQSIETTYKLAKEHSKELEGLVDYRDSLADKYEKQKQVVIASINQAKTQLRNEIAKTKEEILSIPSEALEVKKELSEEIATYKIDSEGLMKEIKILKKEKFIQDKKIENLYTLIERLEAKIKG